MAAEMFTTDMAKALKATLEAISALDTIDSQLERSITTTWMQFMAHGCVTSQWREGAWEVVCECGSGSNAIGPGHSDWCGCYRG